MWNTGKNIMHVLFMLFVLNDSSLDNCDTFLSDSNFIAVFSSEFENILHIFLKKPVLIFIFNKTFILSLIKLLN